MSDSTPREADRSKNIRKFKKRKKRRRPLRGCFFNLLFLLLLPFIIYGGILFASGTEGARQWVESLLTRRLEAPVSVERFRITRSLDLELEGVTLDGADATVSGARIDRMRLHFSPSASRRERAWVYDRMHIRGLTLDIMETREGTREPVALTRMVGLEFWGPRRREGVPALARLQSHANGTADAPAAEASEGRGREWLIISPQRMEISMSGVNIRVRDTQGVSQCAFSDLTLGVDPGLDTVATPATRYSVRGTYELRDRAAQPLHLEILHQQGEWHFIHIEADQRFLRWLGDVLSGESAGPLAADAEAAPAPVD